MQSNEETSCENCHTSLSLSALAQQNFVCPTCGKHRRVSARVRIDLVADPGSFREMWEDLLPENRLSFPEYDEKLAAAAEKSGEKEAVVVGTCRIGGVPTCLFAMEGDFLMGSLGAVVGEKLTALFEYATERSLPVVGYTVSGGARMQEGAYSLLQLAKVAGAAKRHSDEGNFYLVCCADPTTGGVTASVAMLGDVILGEPGAMIGFAGKRVVRQTIGEELPSDFQTAEFQMKNGFLDAIVPRSDQRAYLANMLRIHAKR